MKYYLAEFNKDWADEFSAEGFFVLNETEYLLEQELATKYADVPVHFNFGTNEGWEDELVRDFASEYKYTEITEDEYNTIRKVFGFDRPQAYYKRFGIAPKLSGLLEDVLSEEDYED